MPAALIINTIMKKTLAVTIVIAALMLDSCEPAATFDKPQPDHEKALASFPERIQGRYIAADHASVLTITDKLITRDYDFDSKVHKDSLGASYKITGDTLVNVIAGTKEKLLLKGDTVTVHAYWNDTLFNISVDNILKKYKGYYFLNNRHNDSAWEVNELSLKKGILTVGSISSQNDIQKLKAITENTTDTTSTTFNLSRRQFKQFVRQQGFGKQETFTRMTERSR